VGCGVTIVSSILTVLAPVVTVVNNSTLPQTGSSDSLPLARAGLVLMAGGGLIVLMHLGSGRDEDDRPSKGLGAFMDRATKEGWQFVHVGAYLHAMGKPAWDPAARMAWLEPSLAGGARPSGRPR